jgi:hypothetical protein
MKQSIGFYYKGEYDFGYAHSSDCTEEGAVTTFEEFRTRLNALIGDALDTTLQQSINNLIDKFETEIEHEMQD